MTGIPFFIPALLPFDTITDFKKGLSLSNKTFAETLSSILFSSAICEDSIAFFKFSFSVERYSFKNFFSLNVFNSSLRILFSL